MNEPLLYDKTSQIMADKTYDLAIVGGGIVGLATALALSGRFPSRRLILLEKEPRVGSHQTGHNSGVIHSGVYYKPGSLKASLCARGGRLLTSFCQQHAIPVKRCGKVIVALTPEELPRLQEFYRRGTANGVPGLSLIGPERLREIEPESARACQALHLPEVSITDYGQVARTYAVLLAERGVEIRTGTRVLGTSGDGPLRILCSGLEVAASHLINCGGLQADRLASSMHSPVGLQILPFRGEYLELSASRRNLVKGLLYPVPDPRYPFLGVHLSPRIDGRVEAGPSAVLALKREGYRKTDFNMKDTAQMLCFAGFWRMTARHWRTGLEEIYRSIVKQAFVRSVQRLVPSIRSEDLLPAGSGVRAQAVNPRGELLDDFHLVQQGRFLHVCNAPSPAATASLAIGEHIAAAAAKQFSL